MTQSDIQSDLMKSKPSTASNLAKQSKLSLREPQKKVKKTLSNRKVYNTMKMLSFVKEIRLQQKKKRRRAVCFL